MRRIILERTSAKIRKRVSALLLSFVLLCGNVPGVKAAECFNGVSSNISRSTTYCGIAEHTHTDRCYDTVQVPVCGQEELETHFHTAACYTPKRRLICAFPETEGHSHTDECYTNQDVLLCQLEENEEHTHSEECYGSERVLCCTIPETPAHTHTADCFTDEVYYLCGLENDPSHVHSSACFPADCFDLNCPLQEGFGHTHSEDCYREERILVCTQTEHRHSSACYSANGPVVETELDWKASVASAKLNGDWRHDFLEIAKTQLGYAPDGTNVSYAGGVPRYYTRYGDWYTDDPNLMYDEWCMMFVSFCLYYAGIDALPFACSCPAWLNDVDSALYHPYGDGYTPQPGDIILFTYGPQDFRKTNEALLAEGKDPLPESSCITIAQHVGILVSMSSVSFRTIEGNNGPVSYHSYSIGTEEEPGDEELILGYVSLPSNPHIRTITDLSGRCDITGDFSPFIRPYVRELSFFERVRVQQWMEEHPTSTVLESVYVCLSNGSDYYEYKGSEPMEYCFRCTWPFPENTQLWLLSEDSFEQLSCRVDGNTVFFSTAKNGVLLFVSE